MRFSQITSDMVSIIFDAPTSGPAPSGYLALMSANFAPDFVPVAGTTYAINDQVGVINGNIIYVVLADNFTFFTTQSHNPGTLLYYKVFSYTGSSTSINYVETSPLEGNITTPTLTLDQLITNSTPEFIDKDTDLTINISFTDPGLSITSIKVSYGPTERVESIMDYYEDFVLSDTDVKTKALTNTSGTTYEATIDKSDIGDLGVIYVLVGETASGNIYQLDYVRNVGVNEPAVVVPIYSNFGSRVSNYQLISVPLEADQNTVDDVFGDDLGPYGNKKKWRMFRYTNGTNEEVRGTTPIVPGQGYWLIVKDEVDIDIGPGKSVEPSYSDDLEAGWNLIGNPYPFDLDWEYIKGWSEFGLDKLRVFEDGSFSDGTTLTAYGAGFVMVDNPLVISYPPIENTGGRISGGKISNEVRSFTSIDSEAWEVRFRIKNGTAQYNLGGFGMNIQASQWKDQFDEFTLPRFIEYVEINHNKRFLNISYSKDIVPLSENYEWTFSITGNAENEDMEVVWDNSYFGSNDKQLVLWDVKAQRAIDMRLLNTYKFNKLRSDDFKVYFGSAEYIEEKTRVAQLVLHPVYPNPAQHEFVVSFTLPADEHVSVFLYDMLGRKIGKVTDSFFEAGYHEVSFVPKDLSGTYLIQVNTRHSKAMTRLLIKN